MKEESVKELPHVSVGDSLWAFLDSGLRAIFSATALLMVLIAVTDNGSAVVVVILAGLVHTVAYTLIGLPIFLIFWPKPWSKVWSWYVALPLGFLLGNIAVVFFYTYYPLGIDLTLYYLVTGIYGLVSALASLWVNKNRPRNFDDYN